MYWIYINVTTVLAQDLKLTRLSLSLGGSWGSEAEVLEGGGGEDDLGFSATGAGFSSTFSAAGGGGGG